MITIAQEESSGSGRLLELELSTYGSGLDGSVIISAPNTTINNYTYMTLNASNGSRVISVFNSTEFRVGDEVLIIQMQNGSNNGTAGLYEFNQVDSVNSTNITLAFSLNYSYFTGGFNLSNSTITQVIRVPNYANFTLLSNASIIAPPWNGWTGGIIIFRSSQIANISGNISVDAKGFRGVSHAATYRNQNGYQGESYTGSGIQSSTQNLGGGGGGIGTQDAGGGGGGGYGASGTSGTASGAHAGGGGGNLTGNETLTLIYLGNAGGEAGADEDGGFPGSGGRGGGIIMIYSQNLTLNGRITNNGATGGSGGGGSGCGMGGGGGGSGGSIYLSASNMTLRTGNVTATAGSGGSANGCGGNGGAGAVGRIRLDFQSMSGSTTPAAYNGTYSTYDYDVNDTTPPTITINTPLNTTYYSIAMNFSVLVNENSTAWFSINNGNNLSMTPNASNTGFNYTNSSIADGSYNFTVYANDTSGNIANKSVIFSIYTLDSDGDGILDLNDTLIGNESNLRGSGLTSINITINNQNTTQTFNDTREVLVKDGNNIIINFSYNFSSSSLNLSNIFVKKTDNVLIINISQNISSNKTVYFDDSNFTTLCIKDGIVNDVDDVSSSCTSSNESNFTLCINNNTGYFSGGIACYDNGSRFKIENLSHTAIRGGFDVSSSSSSSDSSSSGGGGGYCSNTWECEEWSFCKSDNTQSRTCELRIPLGCLPAGDKPLTIRQCPQALFDIVTSQVVKRGLFSDEIIVNINLKEINSGEKIDVRITYSLLDELNSTIYEGVETRGVKEELSFEKNIKTEKLKDGNYDLEITVHYGEEQSAISKQRIIITTKSHTKLIIIIIIALLIISAIIFWHYEKIPIVRFLIKKLRNEERFLKKYKVKRR